LLIIKLDPHNEEECMRAQIVWLWLVLAGCGGEGAWVGTYATSGTWKLSGPLEGGRTAGDAAADLLLDELVGAAPVPSFLEDDLRGWLSSTIREDVKTAVDTRVPKDLAPGGAITKLLGETLTTVRLESTLVLRGDEDELEGDETFTAVEYVISGKSHRLTAADLSGQTGISAAWAGKQRDAGTLSIEPHSVTLRYGALVRRILTDLVQAADLPALDAALRDALGCQAIVATILDGGSGLKISLAGWSHTIGSSDLEAICNTAMSKLMDRAVGQFELDSRVEVGGSVSWSVVPSTRSIDLASGADFGGVVNVLPKAIAPKVGVSFTAQRRP
jgi:hypothetical protein